MEMKLKPKTFHYDVGTRWSRDKRGVLSVAGKPDLEVASPPEFRGHAGVWSPQDYLVAAVSACAMTTFLSAAKRRGLDLLSYGCDAQGTLEMADREFRFTRILLKPRIGIGRADQKEEALAAFREAETGCMIARSLTARIESQPEVFVMEHAPAATAR
jgi:organic hydroperoxide reductase OsmC/OhrA